MFPFASHGKYGYSLEYAAEELKAAGDLAKRLGHRLTTHPGQVQSNPQVQPVPARDATVLSGGMIGNSDGPSNTVGKKSIGGSEGPRLAGRDQGM